MSELRFVTLSSTYKYLGWLLVLDLVSSAKIDTEVQASLGHGGLINFEYAPINAQLYPTVVPVLGWGKPWCCSPFSPVVWAGCFLWALLLWQGRRLCHCSFESFFHKTGDADITHTLVCPFKEHVLVAFVSHDSTRSSPVFIAMSHIHMTHSQDIIKPSLQ